MKVRILIAIVAALFMAPNMMTSVNAQTLAGSRFDKMSDSRAGSIATHQIGFVPQTTSQALGSIAIEFCIDSPVPNDTCTQPPGMDASGVILGAQVGNTGFSVHPNTTTNRVVLSRVPLNPVSVPSTYDLENIINPNVNGTVFVRLYLYNSDNGVGSVYENGGIAIYINEAITIGAEVPPSLRFCVGITIVGMDCASADSFFIDFGFLGTNGPRFATSQFLAGTNAEFGYTVAISGTTLTSGSNTITGLSIPAPSVPGVSQFGFNLRANTSPSMGSNVVGPGLAQPDAKYNTPNQYAFANGDILAAVSNSDDSRKFTVSYITNINGTEPGGVYATTLSFICLGNF